MRKQPSEKKKNVLGIAIAAVIAITMIGLTFSSVPFLGSQQQNVERFNGFEVVQGQTGYQVEVDSQVFSFLTHPADAAGVSAEPAAVQKLRSARMVYLTSNFTDAQAPAIAAAQFSLHRILQRQNTYAETAFTAPNAAGLKVITCANASATVPVLLFRSANETTSVSMEGSCIIATARSASSFARIADRFGYELLGVLGNGQ